MALRTGSQYLASLRDARQIVSGGEPIADVTVHPGFRNGAHGIAQFYDFQCLPDMQELMSFTTSSGQRAGMAFKEARSRDDLRRKAGASAAWAEVTCGWMGRSPDYMNSLMAALSAQVPHYAKIDPAFGERTRRICDAVRDVDECLTHTFIVAFGDRGAEAKPNFRVQPNDRGLVLNGVIGLATIAPFANHNLALELATTLDDGTPVRVSFLQPMRNAEGCRWVCRDAFDHERSHFDAPLSCRGDEMDTLAILDDYFVPWDDVFLFPRGAADVARVTAAIAPTMTAIKFHNLVRSISKTRFLFGLAHLIADGSKVNTFANVRERLGEMLHMLYTLEGLAQGAIEGASEDPLTGVWHPAYNTTHVAGAWYANFYPRMLEIIRDLAASRALSSPEERTMDVVGPLLEKHLRTASGGAKNAVSLYRLAWDVVGTEWGGRHDLYEQFSVGGNNLRRMRDYGTCDKTQAIAMVKRILAHRPTPTERFPPA